MKVRSALDFTVKALVELYFHQLFDLFLLIDPNRTKRTEGEKVRKS